MLLTFIIEKIITITDFNPFLVFDITTSTPSSSTSSTFPSDLSESTSSQPLSESASLYTNPNTNINNPFLSLSGGETRASGTSNLSSSNSLNDASPSTSTSTTGSSSDYSRLGSPSFGGRSPSHSNTTSTSTSNRLPSPLRTGTSSIRGLATKSDPNLGQYLTSHEGYSLYIHLKTGRNSIHCYGDCLKRWPPAIILEDQKLYESEEIKADKVMSFKGEDGRNQLTYFEFPLYFFNLDLEPGDRKGQGKEGFYLISPQGTPLKPDEDGRVPGITANLTSTPNSTVEDINPSTGELSSFRKGITVSGTSSMILVPDIYSLKINLVSKSENIVSAMEQIKNYQINLYNSLKNFTKSDEYNFTLIDRLFSFEGNLFTITDSFIFAVYNFENFNSILTTINDYNNTISRDLNNFIVYEVFPSFSERYLRNVKNFLFYKAYKNAKENAFSSLDPMGLGIDKNFPISKVLLDSSEFQSIIPIFNMLTSSNFPSIQKISTNSLSTKVSITYNIN